MRCCGGKLIFELFPPVVTNKGEDIRRLIEQHGLSAVIYLGDDVSDTDAFRMLRGMRARKLHDTIRGCAAYRLASSTDQFS